MSSYGFARLTVGATFILLLIGGSVHATGSSLACPDWPLCFAQVFPEMRGGVLYEHSHRLAATTVGLLTLALAILLWRRRGEDRVGAYMGLAAAVLVIAQGVLGGVTVLYKLPLLVSTTHLAVAMGFFGLLITITLRLRTGTTAADPSPMGRRVGWALVAVYAQLVLGAFVRHTGSGLSCNVDVLLCNDGLPRSGPELLHYAHRLMAVLVAALVTAACRHVWRRGNPATRLLALAGPVLVLAQIALGVWTVVSYIAAPVVTAHLGLGALLFADMLAIYLLLGAAHAGAHQPQAVAGA